MQINPLREPHVPTRWIEPPRSSGAQWLCSHCGSYGVILVSRGLAVCFGCWLVNVSPYDAAAIGHDRRDALTCIAARTYLQVYVHSVCAVALVTGGVPLKPPSPLYGPGQPAVYPPCELNGDNLAAVFDAPNPLVHKDHLAVVGDTAVAHTIAMCYVVGLSPIQAYAQVERLLFSRMATSLVDILFTHLFHVSANDDGGVN